MKVAIIHPWFPQYRAGFFEGLERRASEEGLELTIFYGDAPPEWKERNDVGSSNRFIKLPTRFFHLRGRTLNRKSLKSLRARGPFDLIVVEQAVRNLETYELLLRRDPLAFWGHGRTYTLEVSSGQEKLKQWLTRRAEWFFAYTPGGVDAVVAAGYRRERTTVVQNSIDTSALQRQIAGLTSEAVERFSREHDLRGKTALFVGGLDASKRMDFLLDAVQMAHQMDPEIRLLIAGDGADRTVVEKRVALMPYVSYLGSLFGEDKALAIKAAQVMAMPGRVGLVAVDSFAGGTPIVTTDWEWHAPEFEYLESGLNAVVASNDGDSYARALASTLQDVEGLKRLSQACLAATQEYTVENMVENFIGGLKEALVSSR